MHGHTPSKGGGGRDVGEGYLERVGEERQLLSLHQVLLLILQQHEGTELILHYVTYYS